MASKKRVQVLKKRLKKINQELNQYGVALKKIGDYAKGEFEIVSVLSVHKHTDFLTVVTFQARKPVSGEFGFYTIIFNSNSIERGGAIVVITNKKNEILLVKQHRPALGKWLWEIPRGFSSDYSENEFSISLVVAQKETPLELEVISIKKLGTVAENTGTHAINLSVFLLKVGSFESINSKEKKFKWMSVKEARKSVSDLHSIAALYFLQSKI